MLQNIRDTAGGWITWLLIIGIVIAFALWGVGSYLGTSKSEQVVAKVGSHAITQTDLSSAYEKAYQRWVKQAGTAPSDPKALKAQLLGELIDRQALLSELAHSGYVVGVGQVDQALVSMPAFLIDGKFSDTRFQQVLQRAGLTTAALRAQVADQLLLEQFNQGLAEGAFILPSEVEQFAALIGQQRKIGYFLLHPRDFMAQTTVSKAMVQKAYDAHPERFSLPERVKLRYVILDYAQLKPTAVTEQQVKAYYAAHQNAFVVPEKRLVQRLVFPFPQGATAVQMIKVRQKAKALLARLQTQSAFDAYVKAHPEHAQKDNGEQKNWLQRDQLPPGQADVVFSASIGETKLIEMDQGISLIHLDQVKPERKKPLEEVSASITKQLAEESIQQQYVSLKNRLKGYIQQGDSLKSISSKSALPLKQSGWVSKQGGEGIGHSDAVRNVAFSEDVLQNGKTSPLISLDQHRAVVIQLSQFQPKHRQPLASVKGKITRDLRREQAREKMNEYATKISHALKSGAAGAAVAKQYGLVWHRATVSRNTQSVNSRILHSVFNLSVPTAQQRPVKKTMLANDQGIAVIVLFGVKEPHSSRLSHYEFQAYEEGMLRMFIQSIYLQYLAFAREDAGVKIENALI